MLGAASRFTFQGSVYRWGSCCDSDGGRRCHRRDIRRIRPHLLLRETGALRISTPERPPKRVADSDSPSGRPPTARRKLRESAGRVLPRHPLESRHCDYEGSREASMRGTSRLSSRRYVLPDSLACCSEAMYIAHLE